MRKILLATAALAAFGISQATAADVSITSTVNEDCTLSAAPGPVTLPSDGTVSLSSGYTWSCNYIVGSATITFDSLNNGVTNGGPVYEYDINPSTGASGTSAASFNNTPAVPGVANDPVNSTFTLQLTDGPILVAGTYTDTLAITIAP